MAAISRRGQGGRIYNNTRVRELLRRKCVKPADLTTHFPPKTFARPAQRHALPEHFRSPTQPRRTPAGCAMHSSPTAQPILHRSPSLAPAQRHALPEHFRSPPQRRHRPAGCTMHARPATMHARRPHNPFPAEDLRSPPQPRRTPAGCAMHSRRPHNPFPAAPRCLPFRSASGTKKTAPHSACAMPNVSVDRRCGRSFGLVSRALFATVAGRWRVGVGLRPQPWALRSRRCGRVLRA